MPSGRTRPWPASRDLWHHYWSPKRLAIGVLLLSGSLTVVEVLLWRLDLPLPLSKHYFYLPPVIAALSGYWALHDSKFKICHDLFGSRCEHLVHWLPILCVRFHRDQFRQNIVPCPALRSLRWRDLLHVARLAEPRLRMMSLALRGGISVMIVSAASHFDTSVCSSNIETRSPDLH